MAETSAASLRPLTDKAQERLLGGLRQGSPAAFAELYDRFAPTLHRFAAFRLMGDAQASEDIVIETLAAAIANISRFDSLKSTLAAWLYGIARAQLQSEIRRRKRRKAVPHDAVVSLENLPEQDDSRDLASAAAARLDARRQAQALSRILSETELEILTLQSIDELSIKEISQIVHRSERAVHSLLHRAKQKARKELMKYE